MAELSNLKLVDYTTLAGAKIDIVNRVDKLDVDNESNQMLIDKVYSIMNQPNITNRAVTVLEKLLKDKYTEFEIIEIAEKIITAEGINLKQKETFLNNLQADKCVDPSYFLKNGHFGLNELFNYDPINKKMFLEFIDYGTGKKRAGKGEHAFAILSSRITQQGVGDLDVDGIPVELKVATTKGSGRLGEGGVNPEHAKRLISQIEELTDAIESYSNGMFVGPAGIIKSRGKPGKPQKSLNVVDFVKIVNAHGLSCMRRNEIGTLIFNDRFGDYGNQITQVFQKPNADPIDVLNAYISANFDHYKASLSGGNWKQLTSIAIGTNTGVTASTGNDLACLNMSGFLTSSIPAIIPTQEPEVFYQVNPAIN